MYRVVNIDDAMFERIMDAQSVPDMYGTDIVNALNCIKNSEPLYEHCDACIYKLENSEDD